MTFCSKDAERELRARQNKAAKLARNWLEIVRNDGNGLLLTFPGCQQMRKASGGRVRRFRVEKVALNRVNFD